MAAAASATLKRREKRSNAVASFSICSGVGSVISGIKHFCSDDVRHKVIGYPSLFTVACLHFQAVDQVNDIVEAPTRAVTNERTRNCNGEMDLTCSSAADKDDIALVGD